MEFSLARVGGVAFGSGVVGRLVASGNLASLGRACGFLAQRRDGRAEIRRAVFVGGCLVFLGCLGFNQTGLLRCTHMILM